jgi:hypothetical protein
MPARIPEHEHTAKGRTLSPHRAALPRCRCAWRGGDRAPVPPRCDVVALHPQVPLRQFVEHPVGAHATTHTHARTHTLPLHRIRAQPHQIRLRMTCGAALLVEEKEKEGEDGSDRAEAEYQPTKQTGQKMEQTASPSQLVNETSLLT